MYPHTYFDRCRMPICSSSDRDSIIIGNYVVRELASIELAVGIGAARCKLDDRYAILESMFDVKC